ncbi:MAG TPA: Gfo/Idh/MocA family oxidoreductase [Mycobacterium sp.]|nr:Gfo/Idh/MocA family oxidoreductase [Mycobacterium sp.]
MALFGLGGMGMRHLKIFHGLAPWAHITAVADSHPPFAGRAAAIVPAAKIFHDPLDCLRNADIDAAVVATADDTHHAIVDACIARGVYVLCEKPLTPSAEESLRLVEAERVGGRRLVHVGFMRRYDADYRHIYDTARAGGVGQPILIIQRHHNPLVFNTFEAQQLIASSAAHDFALFRWFTGEEISVVNCATKASDDGSTVTVLITLTSESGILGVVEVGRGPGMRYDIGLDLVGSRGSVTLGSPSLTAHAAVDGVAAQRLPDGWIERFDGAYRAQNAAFLTAVANNSIDGPSTYDGYAANAVATPHWRR